MSMFFHRTLLTSDHSHSLLAHSGSMGPTGEDGIDGDDGAVGDAGPTGPSGPEGPGGDRGFTGDGPKNNSGHCMSYG